jgi:hypothetical protein
VVVKELMAVLLNFINDSGKQYELFVGSSTGSLLHPHLALGKIDKIKEIYNL